MAIQLTERAAREVKTVLEQQNLPAESTFLRLGVRGGGCSGFTYSLDLTDNKAEVDEEFDSFGVKLVCDPKSYLYLNGVTVDYKDEMTVRGFVFHNPNATHSCGCGSSCSA